MLSIQNQFGSKFKYNVNERFHPKKIQIMFCIEQKIKWKTCNVRLLNGKDSSDDYG